MIHLRGQQIKGRGVERGLLDRLAGGLVQLGGEARQVGVDEAGALGLQEVPLLHEEVHLGALLQGVADDGVGIYHHLQERVKALKGVLSGVEWCSLSELSLCAWESFAIQATVPCTTVKHTQMET